MNGMPIMKLAELDRVITSITALNGIRSTLNGTISEFMKQEETHAKNLIELQKELKDLLIEVGVPENMFASYLW
jgi:hypothetical protein